MTGGRCVVAQLEAKGIITFLESRKEERKFGVWDSKQSRSWVPREKKAASKGA